MLMGILSNIFLAIVITLGFNFLNNRESKKNRDLVIILCIFAINTISGISKDIGIIIIGIPLLLFITNKIYKIQISTTKNIILSITMDAIFFIGDIIANLIFNILRMGILREHIIIAKLIYFLGSGIFICLFSKLIGKIMKDFKGNEKKNKKDKIKKIYIWFNIIICAVMIIASFIINKKVDVINNENYWLNLIIFVFAIFSSIFSANMFNKYNLKEIEVKRKNEEIKRMEEYAGYMEELYTNVRQFKHDYKNILLSLSQYIEEKDYDELEKYFRQHILPTESYIEKNDFLYKLKNIKILPLKSVIMSKLIKAQNNGINIFIDIVEEVDRIPMDYIDCMRVFGILLDNAVEEAEASENKVVNFGIIKKSNSIVFVVENSCKENIEHLYKLTEKGFSTKGENRGIGLHNLKEIINKYDNITFNLESKDKIFTAEIWIRI